jgi:hypothetical protein
MKSLFIAASICLFFIVGCKRPSELSKSEVQETIAESNKWHDVSLNEPIDGRYTGTALTENGAKITIEVHQTADDLSTDWKNADGSAGGHTTLGGSATVR